jgi:hypothetical protein
MPKTGLENAGKLVMEKAYNPTSIVEAQGSTPFS